LAVVVRWFDDNGTPTIACLIVVKMTDGPRRLINPPFIVAGFSKQLVADSRLYGDSHRVDDVRPLAQTYE